MKSNATPIIDALKGKYLFIDNELQDGIQRLGLFGILSNSLSELRRRTFAWLRK